MGRFLQEIDPHALPAVKGGQGQGGRGTGGQGWAVREGMLPCYTVWLVRS